MHVKYPSSILLEFDANGALEETNFIKFFSEVFKRSI